MRITKEIGRVIKERKFVAYRCDLCGREWKKDCKDWMIGLHDVRGSVRHGCYYADLCPDCGQKVRDALRDLGVELVFRSPPLY